MGKIKAVDFSKLPIKVKEHHPDLFIKDTLSNLVAQSHSWFYSNETLFKILTEKYLGKCCYDANKNIITITPALLEQEVRNLRADQSISCPIQTRSLPTQDKLKTNPSDLWLASTLKELVRHAVKNRGPGSDDDLFATLIYNYLGKWCFDEQGNQIQISVALLEQQVQYFLKKQVRCHVAVDEILSNRVNDLIKEENACTKGIKFDGTEQTTKEHLAFFLGQMADPFNIREKNSTLKRDYDNCTYKYDYLKQKNSPWNPKRIKTDNTGILTTAKTSVSLSPTQFGNMITNNSFNIILLFALSEVHHDNKYVFKKNAGTNADGPYSRDAYHSPGNTILHTSIEALRKQNKDAVKANKQIEWNEIKGGLPKCGVRAMIAARDNSRIRLLALISMYITKESFGLDYDLPVKIYQPRQQLREYTHKERIQDALAMNPWLTKGSRIEEKFFRQIVNSSWNHLPENDSLKEQLRQLCRKHNIDLPAPANYNRGVAKRYNHVLDITVNRMYINEILPPAPAVLVSPPGEKILSAAGMLTFFPMAVYGTCKMVGNLIYNEDEDWESFRESLKSFASAIFPLPFMLPVLAVVAVGFGYYYAAQNIMADCRLPKAPSVASTGAVI